MPEKEYKPTEELEAKEEYIKDFLTNRLIRLTPEEQTRQIMLMRLVQEYEYPKEWIKTEFEIQKGSKRIGPADIVVFRDVKGVAFQTFVYAHQRGERGEFFTPHPIVELAVKLLDPKDKEKFIDPACGSAGFLVSGMNYVKEKFIKERPDRKSKANEFLKEYAHAHIAGIDINPDLSKVAKMHMII